MKALKPIALWLYIFLISFCLSCANIPEKATPIRPFYKEKYLGRWYEIARLDFKYERDLNNTSATYVLNPDQKSIKVVNRGYNYKINQWKEAIGKATFRGNDSVAQLKVSFFGPFYSGYNVIAIDEDYQYAMVAGKNLDYLWLLSRTKSIPENIKQNYLKQAEAIGYQTKNLLWVTHNKN